MYFLGCPDFRSKLNDFDASLLKVYELYLEYLEKWALLDHDTFQKSLLEEEWAFSSDIVEHIPNGFKVASKRFCLILSMMLSSTGEKLLGRIDELANVLEAKQVDRK